MLVRVRVYYNWGNLPFFNHAAIELFSMNTAFIMLEDDLQACESIYSKNISHKKSQTESLCKQVSEMSIDEIIEQVNRMDVVKYFSAQFNNMHW